MNDKNFIEELRQKREEYGVTQRKLAVACGISRTYFNQIENGTVVPSAELKQTIEKQIERFNPQEPLFLLIDYFRVRFPTTVLMLSWAVMISLCHADMRLPGYLSWNVSFDGADLSAPSRKELVHTSMLCQHFKRRDDGTGICLFHSAVMPEAFLIPEEICQ